MATDDVHISCGMKTAAGFSSNTHLEDIKSQIPTCCQLTMRKTHAQGKLAAGCTDSKLKDIYWT
jgi:hypothetical protein